MNSLQKLKYGRTLSFTKVLAIVLIVLSVSGIAKWIVLIPLSLFDLFPGHGMFQTDSLYQFKWLVHHYPLLLLIKVGLWIVTLILAVKLLKFKEWVRIYVIMVLALQFLCMIAVNAILFWHAMVGFPFQFVLVLVSLKLIAILVFCMIWLSRKKTREALEEGNR